MGATHHRWEPETRAERRITRMVRAMGSRGWNATPSSKNLSYGDRNFDSQTSACFPIPDIVAPEYDCVIY